MQLKLYDIFTWSEILSPFVHFLHTEFVIPRKLDILKRLYHMPILKQIYDIYDLNVRAYYDPDLSIAITCDNIILFLRITNFVLKGLDSCTFLHFISP